MTLDQFTEFMTWATALNVGLFVITAIAIMLAGGPISRIHAGMFGLYQRSQLRTLEPKFATRLM